MSDFDADRAAGVAPGHSPPGGDGDGDDDELSSLAERAAEEPAFGSVEGLVSELEAAVAQRDEYLAMAQARQADFENYRKQMMRRQADHLEQAAATLAEKLLPVLDALDSGIAHGQEALAPVQLQLLGVLEREGLERVDPTGAPFDPAVADAVAHEPGEGEPVVSEVMRAGYRWKGRVLRPAMVKVRG